LVCKAKTSQPRHTSAGWRPGKVRYFKDVSAFIYKGMTIILVFTYRTAQKCNKFNVSTSNKSLPFNLDWIPACAGMTR
jgi:hypothetical protein